MILVQLINMFVCISSRDDFVTHDCMFSVKKFIMKSFGT